MLRFGVDRAEAFANLFAGRVALVTAPTGRNSAGESTARVLQRICNLRLLLAPEHGIRGDRAAGEAFDSETDPETGLEVMSMYSGTSRRLPEAAFRRVDTVVYDIQDVGCRYYTFISTLKTLVEDCAAYGKRLIVLDRPNPLGDRVEGSILRPEAASFVGCHEIPVCYGLTCGEFARMVDAEGGLHCDLHIVPCENWTRDMAFPRWDKEWVKPSPNIPDYETALVYPGTCLIEGTNLSEGRGTEAPFLTVGAPFVDGVQLCAGLRDYPGISAEPIRFTPAASKHQGVECGGIRLHVTDAGAFRPVAMGLRLIKLLQTLYPEDFRLLPGEETLPFISNLAGCRDPERPDWNPEALIQRAEAEREAYLERCKNYRIYG